jgi:23S rRNA pseudouridine2605 synthase
MFIPKMTSPPQRTNRKAVPQRKRAGHKSSSGPPAERAEGPQRIAKLLARAGIASRREIERMIADGRIALNGEKLTTPATLLETLEGITVDGRPVRPAAATRLFRFYKPPATLTAAHDRKGRPTIYDRLPAGLPRLMPVGRLDFMTEGLLLLTNDGELKRQLELPRTGVVRTYRARAYGHVTQDQLEKLAEGITIEGVHYGSINANLERRTGSNCWVEMSLTEGKNREVRRVLAFLGLQVSRLIRTAYGPLTLDGLAPSDVDEIDSGELDAFRRTLR